MAFAQPPKTFSRAKERSMFLNRQNHVPAATGIKPALAAKDRTEHPLVSLDQQDQHKRNTLEKKPHAIILRSEGVQERPRT